MHSMKQYLRVFSSILSFDRTLDDTQSSDQIWSNRVLQRPRRVKNKH